MRVLIVAHGHPELSPGGAEQASYRLFEGLRKQAGVDAWFLAWEEPKGGSDRTPSIHAHSGRPRELLLSGGSFDRFLLSERRPEATQAFAALLGEVSPDVVHFHHYANIGLETIAAVRRACPRARVFLTLHEFMAICHHHGLMVKSADYALCEEATDTACAACFPGFLPADFARRRSRVRTCFDQVDRFIAPSAFLRERYLAWGIPGGRIVQQDNGIDHADPAAPRAISPGERRTVFGFFGQIHPFKGLHTLLGAFDQLARWPRQATQGLRLVINGAHLELNHPDYVAGFNGALARHAGSVSFAGPYEQKDLPRLMSEVDWVVVPSIWWENSPLVIEEALLHRRPIVCSDIGGMREKVAAGRDGYHFPVGDAAALATLMVRLAEDRDAWQRLRSTMRAPALIEDAVARHLDLYASG